MMRVVLDTNVLASGFTSAGGVPGRLLTLWGTAAFELIISEHIVQELERTLAKSYFQARYRPDQVAKAMERLRRYAVVTAIIVEVHGVATHPEDDLVLATAVSAQASVLATGDRRLRDLGSYLGVTVRTPRELLNLLDQPEGA